MAKYSGRLVSVGWDREATRGLGVVPALWQPHVDVSFQSRIKDARVSPSLGRLADSEQHHVLGRYSEGDISGEVRSHNIGYPLYALTGTHGVTGPTDTTAFTHTFTAIDNAAQHDTLSITIQDPNGADIYELAALQSLEFEVPLDGVATFASTWRSRVAQETDTKVVTITNEQKFPRNKAEIKVAADIAGLAAASVLSLKNFRLTMMTPLVDDDVLGTIWPEDFLVTSFGAEGELTLNVENDTWRNYFLNETKRALEFKITSPSLITGAATTYASLTVQFPSVDFFGWDWSRPLDDISTQTMSFKANYDKANAQEIVHSIVLVNGKATY